MEATRTAPAGNSNDEDLISAYEASALLGINRSTVVSRVVAGKLTGKEVAGRIVVTRASVMALKAEMDAADNNKKRRGGRKRAASRSN